MLQIKKMTNNSVVAPSHMTKLKCQEKYRNDTLHIVTLEKTSKSDTYHTLNTCYFSRN